MLPRCKELARNICSYGRELVRKNDGIEGCHFFMLCLVEKIKTNLYLQINFWTENI